MNKNSEQEKKLSDDDEEMIDDSDFDFEKDEEMIDDDVICLDDPYQQLDSKSVKKSPRKIIQQATEVVLSSRLTQNLNVSPVSLSNLNKPQALATAATTPMLVDSLNVVDKEKELMNAAIKHGFREDEIKNALKLIPSDSIKLAQEQQFLRYLSMNRELTKCSIDSSQYKFKSNQSSIKNSSSAFNFSSLATNKTTYDPINFKGNSNDDDDDDDVKIVDVTTTSKKKTTEPKILYLEKYAEMVSKQGFDNKDKELENKEARMLTLSRAMSQKDQQIEALSKINALKMQKASSPPTGLTSPVSAPNSYNPKRYETNNNNNSVLFTNFNDKNERKEEDDDKEDTAKMTVVGGKKKKPSNNKQNPPKTEMNKDTLQRRSNSSNPYSRDSSLKRTGNQNKNVSQNANK